MSVYGKDYIDDLLVEEAEEAYLLGKTNPGKCQGECQREVDHLFYVRSRTQYDDDNLNKDWSMCMDCCKEYHLHWDEMWSTYYSGIL